METQNKNMESKVKVSINKPLQAVHAAITSQKGIEGWWATNTTVATEVGGVSKMKFDKEGMIFDMEFRIDELKDNRVLWTCISNTNPTWVGSTISFDLNSNGNSTEVTFKHYNFDAALTEEGFGMVNQTWGHFISNSLKSYCENGAGQPWN